ncbi:serpin family protein [Arthrobacter sp. B0490]|uniref:serpin family protein n=1 Tax=Arthrobacter sp. B0490 TaxID=2058891 RepID=UPI000CE3DFCF|nr:serpin family protein [Arthrobacter sp. B0490]
MDQRRTDATQTTRRGATATAALVLLTACGTTAPDQQRAPVERVVVQQDQYPEAQEAILRSSYRLGAALTASPDSNQVTSPLSALYALSMLRAGAGTTTAEEMDAVLGFTAEHHEAMNALLGGVQQFDGDPGDVDEENPPDTPLLHLANAVFVPEEGQTGDAFLDVLARQYGAGVYPVDFADPSTSARIDDWVSQETGGRIEAAPLKATPGTTLSLLNTVYFAAAWEEPFDAADTRNQRFTLPSGAEAEVPTMHAAVTVRHVDGAGWSGIDLPYGEGFFMRLVLPDEGSAPAWDEQQLADIADALDAAEPVPVALALPAWDHAYDQNLLGLLTALGLEETLGPGADFGAIQPGSVLSGGAQAANITVAEKGTIAAAVTHFAIMTSARIPPDLSISFDRPFGYQVIHEETGLAVVMGTVADPR